MKRMPWVLLLLALLSLAACNQQTSNNTTNTASSEEAISNVTASELPVNHALYAGAIAAARQNVTLPIPPFLIGSPFGAPLTLDTFAWDCRDVTATGNLSDPDDDGIPADAHYSGYCSVTGNGTTFKWTLNYDLKDANSADPLSGFSASGQITWEAVGQAKLVWTINKHEVAKSGGGYNLIYQGNWEYTDYTDPNNNATVNYDFSGTWTPDDPNGSSLQDIFNRAGTFDMSGSLDVNGSCTAHASFNTFNIHFNDDYCADSGNINVSGTDCDGNSYTVSVSWSSCDGP